MSSDKKLTEAERNRPEKPGNYYFRYRAQKLKEYGDDVSNKNKRFTQEYNALDEKALKKLKDDHEKLVEVY